jgi:hypothetical protein
MSGGVFVLPMAAAGTFGRIDDGPTAAGANVSKPCRIGENAAKLCIRCHELPLMC